MDIDGSVLNAASLVIQACVAQPGDDYRIALKAFAAAAREAFEGGASVAAVALQWRMSQGPIKTIFRHSPFARVVYRKRCKEFQLIPF